MKLDLKKFCLLLAQAGGRTEPDIDVNPYLLDHILMPTLNGDNVRIGDIDFSRFDEEDIENLAEYYDCLCRTQRDVARLGTKVGEIPPTACKARAFC